VCSSACLPNVSRRFEERISMLAKQRSTPPRPPRVRHEPPTISEAFAAAADLTTDADLLVEIAAGLMGIPVDQARPHLSAVLGRRSSVSGARVLSRPTGRTVVVERRRRMAGSP
jgi:hypothetical protein